jgi:hypothetical protein
MHIRTTFAAAGVVLSVAIAPGRALAAAPRVGVTHALVKVRPSDPAPAETEISIDAARNEVEPFQILVSGGDDGLDGVRATASELTGPDGASIAAAALYREALYDVVTPSNTEGAAGPWPDPLVPDLDAYQGERRDAFPFDVPAGATRAIWVEVFVPLGTAAGTYRGTVSVTADGGFAREIAVALRVRAFDLPSTATLRSAFGVRWDVCAAHLGSYEACGDPGTESYLVLYARAALDHRVSLENVVYDGPHDGDWSHFDSLYGPLLDGGASTRLEGARLTTIRLKTHEPAEMADWHDHFEARGWLDRLFDYTCDEPPAGCSFGEIAGRAAPVHAAGLRTLVTTDIDHITAEGLTEAIDIAVPVINYLDDKGGPPRRADYDPFLASNQAKELWTYQSCMSHGCGGGCVGTDDPYFTGWPSYMIDVSAIQNRAMEWVSFNMDVTGELYFETSHLLASAWDQQCDFSGNGDGTLFYPGTPDRIGGTTHIPIESIRLKLVREGMEDYEYLHLLCALGDCDAARAEASALFPAPYRAAVATPEDLYAARARLADRIEALAGGPAGADGGPDEHGAPEEPSMTGGCGCRAGSSGGGSLAGIFLVLLALRRRPR